MFNSVNCSKANEQLMSAYLAITVAMKETLSLSTTDDSLIQKWLDLKSKCLRFLVEFERHEIKQPICIVQFLLGVINYTISKKSHYPDSLKYKNEAIKFLHAALKTLAEQKVEFSPEKAEKHFNLNNYETVFKELSQNSLDLLELSGPNLITCIYQLLDTISSNGKKRSSLENRDLPVSIAMIKIMTLFGVKSDESGESSRSSFSKLWSSDYAPQLSLEELKQQRENALKVKFSKFKSFTFDLECHVEKVQTLGGLDLNALNELRLSLLLLHKFCNKDHVRDFAGSIYYGEAQIEDSAWDTCGNTREIITKQIDAYLVDVNKFYDLYNTLQFKVILKPETFVAGLVEHLVNLEKKVYDLEVSKLKGDNQQLQTNAATPRNSASIPAQPAEQIEEKHSQSLIPGFFGT